MMLHSHWSVMGVFLFYFEERSSNQVPIVKMLSRNNSDTAKIDIGVQLICSKEEENYVAYIIWENNMVLFASHFLDPLEQGFGLDANYSGVSCMTSDDQKLNISVSGKKQQVQHVLIQFVLHNVRFFCYDLHSDSTAFPLQISSKSNIVLFNAFKEEAGANTEKYATSSD